MWSPGHPPQWSPAQRFEQVLDQRGGVARCVSNGRFRLGHGTFWPVGDKVDGGARTWPPLRYLVREDERRSPRVSTIAAARLVEGAAARDQGAEFPGQTAQLRGAGFG